MNNPNNNSISLIGKRILVTRAKEQAADFIAKLEQAGAKPILFSTIRTVATKNCKYLEATIRDLPNFSGLIFTSSNACRFFFQYVKEKVPNYQELFAQKPIYAIGENTSALLQRFGFSPLTFAHVQNATELADAMLKLVQANDSYLFPCGNLAENILQQRLETAQVSIKCLPVYTTEFVIPENLTVIKQALENAQIDLVTFFSPSSIHGFASIIPLTLLKQSKIAAIGTTTAKAAICVGLKVDLVPSQPTASHLVQAIEKYYNTENGVKLEQ